MRYGKFFDITSFLFAGIILLISLFIFYSNSNQFISSFAAAIMTAVLAWGTYVIIRWLMLANRN